METPALPYAPSTSPSQMSQVQAPGTTPVGNAQGSGSAIDLSSLMQLLKLLSEKLPSLGRASDGTVMMPRSRIRPLKPMQSLQAPQQQGQESDAFSSTLATLLQFLDSLSQQRGTTIDAYRPSQIDTSKMPAKDKGLKLKVSSGGTQGTGEASTAPFQPMTPFP